MSERKAVVLLSGGLEFTNVVAIARKQSFSIYAPSFNSEQNHNIELNSARCVAREFDVQQYVIVNVDLGRLEALHSRPSADLNEPYRRRH